MRRTRICRTGVEAYGDAFIDRADEVLDAGGGVLKALKELVARSQYPAFFRNMARLEAEAVSLHVYAALAVPGLLQTEEYARAVFTMRRPLLDDETVEERSESLTFVDKILGET